MITSQPQRIGIGIIGAGRNTVEKHIPGFLAQDGVRIVAVCNRTQASSQRVADQFDIPHVFDQWQALIEDDLVDAVMIGTWPYRHHPLTLAALAADRHVLCEARMAMNAAEAHEMAAAAAARPHLVAQIVPSPFTLPVDRTIQRLLAEGYLGNVLALAVRSTVNGAFVDEQGPLHWRHDRSLSGLNVMHLGIWYEAMMRWLGPAATVMAEGTVFVSSRQDPHSGEWREVQVPDHLGVMAQLENGAQASFFVSNVTGLAGADEAMLFGSQGTLRVCQGRLYGGRRGDVALEEITIQPHERGGWRVEEEFINAIRGLEEVTHTTFADGLQYMQFTEAVARSMREGRRVRVADM